MYAFRAILSELGGGDNDACRQQLSDLFKYLSENDEWVGWAYWAAGPIWGTASPCCGPDVGSIEPGQITKNGTPKYVSPLVYSGNFC